MKIDTLETVMRQQFKKVIVDQASGGQLADASNNASPLIAEEEAKVS